MNEQEANKKTKEMIDNRKQIFCPMRNHYCRIDCECYTEPEVKEHCNYMDNGYVEHTGKYYIVNGFCTCYALKGASD